MEALKGMRAAVCHSGGLLANADRSVQSTSCTWKGPMKRGLDGAGGTPEASQADGGPEAGRAAGGGGSGWEFRKLCVYQLLFSSSANQWFLLGPKDQGLQDPWRQHKEPPQSTYLLVRWHGLVRAVRGAGKVAGHFRVCGFTLGGLAVTGRFSGKVTLFSRGCCVSGQQGQQGAAGTS